jgi:hypothetical protein
LIQESLFGPVPDMGSWPGRLGEVWHDDILSIKADSWIPSE